MTVAVLALALSGCASTVSRQRCGQLMRESFRHGVGLGRKQAQHEMELQSQGSSDVDAPDPDEFDDDHMARSR